MIRRIVSVLMLLVLVAACDSGDDGIELTTTTTTESSATTSTAASDENTTTTAADDTTETTESVESEAVDDYSVIIQTDGAEGDRLWVLIEPGTYTSVDIENFVFDLLDGAESPIWQIHVFDDEAALNAARIDANERTTEEQELVDAHYLVSVDEGISLTFQGPFAAFGGSTFGS